MLNIVLSRKVMEQLIVITKLLGDLNLLLTQLPNPYFLTYLTEMIDSISSNKIENIHSTIDLSSEEEAIKEKNNMTPYVRYRETTKQAHLRFVNSGLITINDLIWINNQIRGKNIGLRKTPVTIKNSNNKIIHYGIEAQNISKELSKLINLINDDQKKINPIIKTLLIHHKFEHIHPFTDGNGRTGRILNALLFYKFELLKSPATLISYSISKDKNKYYNALNEADKGKYNKYLENMLDILRDSLEIGISFSQDISKSITNIIKQVDDSKKLKEITLLCFRGFKISNSFLIKKSGFNNKTITKYTNELIEKNIIEIIKKGKYKLYKNIVLEKILNKYFKDIM